MDRPHLHELVAQFQKVALTSVTPLAQANPRVIALVAKWEPRDLVPGLSDMDFRIICDDSATAEDWVQIDRVHGRVHLDMVKHHPQWNRINEHTAGAGMTVSEVFDDRTYDPEYFVWSLWWGKGDWLERLKEKLAGRPFGATDEHYHLAKFLSYFSPYVHGIDPPINLGRFEPKYALHSRCWHYFAPPMLSAACLLARRNFPGKRAGLEWLRDHSPIGEQAGQVLKQVDAHYDTPQQNGVRLQDFEAFLYSAFERILEPVLESVSLLDIDRTAGRDQIKKQLKAKSVEPLAALLEDVRFARIRACRYYFYVNAPPTFDAARQTVGELIWVRKLTEHVFSCLRQILGEPGLTPRQCFERLGVTVDPQGARGLEHMIDMATRTGEDPQLRRLYIEAVDLFPPYYRLLEQALAQAGQRAAAAPAK